MYSNLPDILLADGTLQQIAADCQALVEQELSSKSGVSATALKVAYKAVTTFAPGYYKTTVENMVPDLLHRLQPFWSDFHAAGGGQFGDYLAKRGEEVSEAVLGVTDDMTQDSEHPSIVKTYIEAALPSVGTLVEKYAA